MRKKKLSKQEFWIDGVTPIEVGIANEVAVEIVEEAMKRFNVSYEVVDRVLEELGYWSILNDSSTAAYGGIMDLEPVYEKIKGVIFR